ncbi:MAG TPA: cysteine--tRNA ligase [Bacteroidales bacterium]|nr:cysteine--tRNA ligase [Bacteroidales bacterium]
MQNDLKIYNTLHRRKEVFEPINTPHVGMYVCGPTVYGDAHLGHSRPAITFDIVFRYLQELGYKVRYVRNITDVGHLENDADSGEDKIAKKARLEQVEPMEIVQYYSDRYHYDMDLLNIKKPSIEPRASGHIIEQIEMVKKILDSGYAYERNGSVYFNVGAYAEKFPYGELSGRKYEELIENTRELAGQEEKLNSADFALWKKAAPEHIMRWTSPWSEGFPGWHMECSAMSKKYLGNRFDIHGGGMDLMFPHHESEIAQSKAANKGEEPVKYWMHNNMITINGQKMGKSLGNFITLQELFSGNNKILEKAYSPMNIRFFILQAHYRSPLDFSNEALQAAEKGLDKLMAAAELLTKLKPQEKSGFDVDHWIAKCYEAMNDDFNTPILIAHLFEAVRVVNSVNARLETISAHDLEKLQAKFKLFVFDILGLETESENNEQSALLDGVMNTIIELRQQAKHRKDWPTADLIRNELTKLNISLKDTKEGTEWFVDK